MKLPLPRPLFPTFVVSPADEDEFAAIVTVFIDKLLAEEYAYRVTHHGHVDATKWKHLKQIENATVYHGRGVGATARSSASSIADSGERASRHKLLPSFLTVGKVPDALDDLMYSFTAPTRESTLIQSSYVNTGIVDVEILHTIQRPTLDEPFSQLSIKWLLLMQSPVLAPRDYVFIDAHGTRVLPNGSRVGYRFSHTIELAGAGPMVDRGFVRSNFSETTIFREDLAHGLVHEYGRSFYAPEGALPTKVFVAFVAMHISSTSSQSRIGECKKLALALRHKDAGKWTVAVPAPTPVFGPSQKNECGVCTKTLHMINKSRCDCALCGRRLCVSCRIRKELSFLTVNADLSVHRVRVSFCAFCVQQAIKLPSHAVATEEYLIHHTNFYCMPDSLRVATESGSTLRNFLFSA